MMHTTYRIENNIKLHRNPGVVSDYGMLFVQFEGNVDARNKGDAAIERKMMMSMVFVSNPSLHFQRLVLML
jgi:hypothetical protein